MKIVISKKINYNTFIYTKLGLPNVSLMFPFLLYDLSNGV